MLSPVAVMTDIDLERLEGEGLLDLLRAGTGLINHSSVRPSTVRRTANLLEPRGVHVVDAPVSGAIAAAYAGELSAL